MRITSKGQVTIPLNVRQSLGLLPSKSEIEFVQDENNRWYIAKTQTSTEDISRFRTAYQKARLIMSTEEIMALTRDQIWSLS